MGKKKIDDTSDSTSPTFQHANKRKHASTPAFCVAQVSRRGSTLNRTSRLTTINKNAHGRRGYQTEDRRLITNDPEVPPDEAVQPKPVLDLPLSDLGELDYEPETSVPPQLPKSKRNRQNTTSVRFFFTSIHLKL
jgi:hypothetical protein